MKRVIIVTLVAIMLITCLCGCGSATQSSSEKTTVTSFDLTSFKSSVADSAEQIYEHGIVLSNMARYEYNYWAALIKISGNNATSDKAFEKALAFADVTAEETEKSYTDICSAYKSLVNTEVSGNEATEIYNDFREMFDAYDSLYNLVNDPGGSLSDFSSDYNDAIGDIKEYYNKLAIFIEDMTKA